MNHQTIALASTVFFIATFIYNLFCEARPTPQGSRRNLGLIFPAVPDPLFLKSQMGQQKGKSLLLRGALLFVIFVSSGAVNQLGPAILAVPYAVATLICIVSFLNIQTLHILRLTVTALLLSLAGLVNIVSLFNKIEHDHSLPFATMTVAIALVIMIEYYGYLHWYVKESLNRQSKQNQGK